MDINELKKQELEIIKDFYYKIEDFGHIFHLDPKILDEPFSKILENISIIEKYLDDSYEI